MSDGFHRLERTKNVKRNVLFGLLQRCVSLLLPFAVRTVLIYRFGAEYLGLNSVFSSILQVLNLAEMGFGSAVTYSMYRPVAEGDRDGICALLNAYRRIYRWIGMFIFCAGIALMPFLPRLIADTRVPGDLNLYLWYLIFLSDSVLSYLLYGYQSSIPYAFQRNDLLSRVDMALMVCKSAVQILVLMYADSFYWYLLAFPAFTVLRNLAVSRMVSKHYPEYVCRGEISASRRADLREKVRGLLISKLCITSRNGIDSICISAILGLRLVGMYNNYYYIMNALVGVSMILCQSMIPGIGNSIVTDTVEKNYRDMRRFQFMYLVIAGWASACLLCLYQPFMRLWVGEQLMLPDSIMIILTVYFYLLKMGDMRWVYSEGAGLWWECRYLMILEAVVNVVLNILFAYLWGVFGIALATVLSLFFVNFLGSSHILFRSYFQNGKLGEYFTDHLRYALMALLCCGVTYACCRGVSAQVLTGGSSVGDNVVLSAMTVDRLTELPRWLEVKELLIRIPVCLVLPPLCYWLICHRTAEFREAWRWMRSRQSGKL